MAHPRWRRHVAGPSPPVQVRVPPGRPVKALVRQVHLMGHQVAEVLVRHLQAPIRHQLPKDPVGMGPSMSTSVCQDEQVPLALPVQLKDLADLPPELLGLQVRAELDDVPVVREVLLQELQVKVLPVISCRIPEVQEPPKGGKVLLELGRPISRSICRYFCLRWWNTVRSKPPPLIPRSWRSVWRSSGMLRRSTRWWGVEAQVEVQRHALEVEDFLSPYDSGDAYQAPF